VGEWKHGMQDGQGTLLWLSEGDKYVGGWKDGHKHGYGVFYWKGIHSIDQLFC
jgi:hypothetical protein